MNTEQKEINIAVTELVRDQDSDAARITSYTRETSGLGELCNAFPLFEGRDLLKWLERYGERGNVSVLEFGGGIKQHAAQAIVFLTPELEKFVGYEIKPISPEVSKILGAFPQYTNIQGGLSEFDRSLVGANFDIIFAHNVAEHLPHPFLLVSKLYDCLEDGGLLFMNGLNLYRNVAEELFQGWRKKGHQFELKYDIVDENMDEANIVRCNIVIQKSSQELLTPAPTNELLVDAAGILYPTVIYEPPKI